VIPSLARRDEVLQFYRRHNMALPQWLAA
jgi:hypothetical protein